LVNYLILLSLLVLANLLVVYRAVNLMRHQNRVRLTALAIKASLNTITAATVLAQPVLSDFISPPWHALRLLPLFANPIALIYLFRSERTSPWLLRVNYSMFTVSLVLVAWYVLGFYLVVPQSELILELFPIDATHRFGPVALAYLAITLGVLAALLWSRVAQRGQIKNRGIRWEVLYLSNGLLRGLILLGVVLRFNARSLPFDAFVGISMSLSVILDSWILLRYGTNREVFFHSEHGLPLVSRWNPEIEQLLHVLKNPKAYCNPRYSLLDAGQQLAWSSTKVTRTLHHATGLHFKDILTHFRLKHYDHLSRQNPELSKLERVQQSGFSCYSSYHYAHKRSKKLA
jgi:hypothetical protein